jgi:hypothetical protein
MDSTLLNWACAIVFIELQAILENKYYTSAPSALTMAAQLTGTFFMKILPSFRLPIQNA